ncbi:ABC transporter permease [Microbacterium horticulturae]|uniref:ABC transporter permease n=1 Tax=Microbacterium horticulturae TaxID=3028316 RepID=A0ABY8BXB5_9MICO|nr:ABC transporter permease [Microbacterium sp. KACC 23027]WEG08540.1 ABC transporter permease [Microbacterium sp. KACC 23027]
MSTPASPTLAQSVWLVAEREIGSKLRSKAFVISTLIMFAFALAGVIWGGFSAANPSQTPVAVTSQSASVVSGMSNLDVTTADSADAAIALVKSGDVDAAIVPDADSPVQVKIVAKDAMPQELVAALSVSPPVQLLDSSPEDALLRYLVAIGFGIVFLLSASMFGSTIAQSVVEEKQTRVVEILISAIPVRALMAGKVIGNTILAMAQIIVLVAIAIIGLSVSGQNAVLAGLGGPMVWFAVFFLFGFILLAALFAGAAAMVSRQEDIGSTTMPLTMLILAPYILVILFNDNPVVLTVMSYVPFSAPVAMPLRLYLGSAQWWEPLVSLVLLVVTCIAAVLVGSKIYRNSLLRMGARVKLGEALKA